MKSPQQLDEEKVMMRTMTPESYGSNNNDDIANTSGLTIRKWNEMAEI